jgi:hypothetical protein
MNEHDLEKTITLKELNALYTQNKNTLTLTAQGQKYKTLIEYFSEGSNDYFNYKFLDDNEREFIEILVHHDLAELLIDLVNKNVTRIGALTPLETVFYLTTRFCVMLGIRDIKLIDAARHACKDDVADVLDYNRFKNSYNLQLYRILATPLPLHSISIYSKFFKNVRVPELNQDDMAVLESLRGLTIRQFKEMTQSVIQSMYDKIKDLPEDNKHRRYYVSFYNDMMPILTLPLFYDALTLFAFFDGFLHHLHCQEYALLLNSMDKVLYKREPYKSLLGKTGHYTVYVSDSIYSGKRRKRRHSKVKHTSKKYNKKNFNYI